MTSDSEMNLQESRRVLEVEARAILDLVDRLGPSFDMAVDILASCRGRVVTTGMDVVLLLALLI